MRDIATLKERVDLAERHLKTTEAARNRESEALMETWRKVRERFNHQEGEIARHRAEVDRLTEDNEALSRMIDELIGIIDGNIERGRDETVPKIATLAEELLSSEPTSEDLARFDDDARAAFDSHFAAPEDAVDAEPLEPELVDEDAVVDNDGNEELEVSRESLSPGIQALIRRVEGSVRETNGFDPDAHADGGGHGAEADDELARELEEIELLRNELSGLRDRISASDG